MPAHVDSTNTSTDTLPSRLSSVTTALLVLKAFSVEEPEQGISAIAKKLGLAKSTVHRLAVPPASEGFLEQNAQNGRYRLGLTVFELGTQVRQRMDVSSQSLPLLSQLRDQTQEAVHLAVLSQTSIMYLYNLEGSRAIGIRSHIGARKPAFCTAEGRVLLAFESPDMVEAALAEDRRPRTPKTVTDLRKLRQILAEVRHAGYAIDDEESEADARSVAAPVRDATGKVIAAVGLAGPTRRLTKKELRTLLPMVLATADAVSQRLGYRAS